MSGHSLNQANQGSRPYALSIAGFDPSAGAGVLADIKTFESNGIYGFGVTSALTWQNDQEFEKVEWIDFYKIVQQISILLRRFDIKYIKVGLIENIDVLDELIEFLNSRIKQPVVIYDPIMKASAGYTFHETSPKRFISILKKIYCLTPNLPEAKKIFGESSLYTKLMEYSSRVNILLKGGHATDAVSSDILFTKGETHSYSNARLPNGEKHGSGCVLSSALTAQLALGKALHIAAENANKYTHRYLASSDTLLGHHNTQPYENYQ